MCSMKIVKMDNRLDVTVGDNDERVVRQGQYKCLSRREEYYRLILSSSHLILQHATNPSKVERFEISELYGCRTYSHKKRDEVKSDYQSAYIGFILYPRLKKKNFFSKPIYRDKLIIVFEICDSGSLFEQNKAIAKEWRNETLKLLTKVYPKWQMPVTKEGLEGVLTVPAEKSKDVVDRASAAENEPSLSLSSYIPFLRRYYILVNPKSGNGKSLEIANDAAAIFKECSIDFYMEATKEPGHAIRLMTKTNFSEFDGIVAIGGDGLLYEILNGLRSRNDWERLANIPLGVIAGGSGNGLARSIADYCNEGENYLQQPALTTTLFSARGKSNPVNLVEITLDARKIYSFLSVGWGLMADIDVESECLRTIGEIRFTIWSFYRLLNLRKYHAKLTYVPVSSEEDSENANFAPSPVTVVGEFVCVYAVYQSYIGTDLLFAPDAQRNDGVIHLLYLPGNIGRGRATQFLTSIDKGTHLNVDGVIYVKVKEFTIHNDDGIPGILTVDGERVTGNTITVKVSSTPLEVFSI